VRKPVLIGDRDAGDAEPDRQPVEATASAAMECAGRARAGAVASGGQHLGRQARTLIASARALRAAAGMALPETASGGGP
jgi:hypothetical protein